MANTDPMGDGPVVTLKLSDNVRALLRGVFWDVRAELADCPDSIQDPPHLRREEMAHDALLVALDSGAVVADPDARAVLFDLAQLIDAGTEYKRLLAEHAALLDCIAWAPRSSHAGQFSIGHDR